jgi:predicted acetyltransferase
MRIELVPATIADHDAILRNLYQFYLYEFSRFTTEWRVQADGRFAETDLDDCWTEDYRHVFLIEVDDGLAGFAIVDLDLPDDTSRETPINELAEFFILPSHHRRGIGERVARQLFDRFPGEWELYIVETNADALAFWRKVIGQYTVGQYTERHRPEERDYAHCFDNSNYAPVGDLRSRSHEL